MEKGRILCLDLGEKRIGVAISDPLGWTAQGLCTFPHRTEDKDWQEIEKILQEYPIRKIVVGMPYSLNGEKGPAAQKITLWMKEAQKKTSIPMIPWDERYSTEAAEEILLEADLSRKKRRKVIDKLAAVMILQNYLDSLKDDD